MGIRHNFAVDEFRFTWGNILKQEGSVYNTIYRTEDFNLYMALTVVMAGA